MYFIVYASTPKLFDEATSNFAGGYCVTYRVALTSRLKESGCL